MLDIKGHTVLLVINFSTELVKTLSIIYCYDIQIFNSIPISKLNDQRNLTIRCKETQIKYFKLFILIDDHLYTLYI